MDLGEEGGREGGGEISSNCATSSSRGRVPLVDIVGMIEVGRSDVEIDVDPAEEEFVVVVAVEVDTDDTEDADPGIDTDADAADIDISVVVVVCCRSFFEIEEDQMETCGASVSSSDMSLMMSKIFSFTSE